MCTIARATSSSEYITRAKCATINKRKCEKNYSSNDWLWIHALELQNILGIRRKCGGRAEVRGKNFFIQNLMQNNLFNLLNLSM